MTRAPILANAPRVERLAGGVDVVSRWRRSDEARLPAGASTAPAFLPRRRPLDEVLHRPSLDERLTDLLMPRLVDPDLLQPARLRDARLAAVAAFERAARRAAGPTSDLLRRASAALDDTADIDADVQEALAALMRG